jgi:hypothetical protein
MSRDERRTTDVRFQYRRDRAARHRLNPLVGQAVEGRAVIGMHSVCHDRRANLAVRRERDSWKQI